MAAFLADTCHRVQAAKEAGATSFGPDQARFDPRRLLQHPQEWARGQSGGVTGGLGRPRRSAAANIIRRFDKFPDDVLRFATDFTRAL